MPTLANLQGSSLVPDLTQSLNLALGISRDVRAQEDAALKQAQIDEQMQALLPDPTADPAAKRATEEAALLRLGAIAPEIARVAQDTIAAGDLAAQDALRFESEKGVRNSALILQQPDFASKQRAIGVLAQEAAARGEPLDKFIEWQNMTEDELGLEMQRIQIAAQDIKTILNPALGPEQFTPIYNAAGEIVGQKSSKSGKVIADPRTATGAGLGGMASAKTEILADGSTIMALPDGTTQVTDPEGNIVTGDQRLDTLMAAQKAALKQARATSGAKASGTQAIAKSGEAFASLSAARKNVANLDDIVRLIDEGAWTGPVAGMLPSFRAATVELENARGKLGLDVVGAVTFGALSKGELDLAMTTALPTNLTPPDLRDWVLRRKAAQEKLMETYEDAAIYLGSEGNTIAGWVQKGKAAREGAEVTEPVVIRFDAQGNIIE